MIARVRRHRPTRPLRRRGHRGRRRRACAWLVLDGAAILDRSSPRRSRSSPSCALVGEFVPLKVFTRGAEGEVTHLDHLRARRDARRRPARRRSPPSSAPTSSPTRIRRKPPQKVAFNVAQYAITVAAGGAGAGRDHRTPARAPTRISSPTDLIRRCSRPRRSFFVVNTGARLDGDRARPGASASSRYLAARPLLPGLDRRPACSASRRSSCSPPTSRCRRSRCCFLPLFAVHRGGREAIAKEHQALHDALTGLPNRELFRDRIDQAIRAGAPLRRVRRGDDHGPRPLQGDQRHARPPHAATCCCRRSRAGCRPRCASSDTVARLGGDEFGVLLPRVRRRPDDANVVAQQLLAHLREPFVLEGMRLEIDASIGIALHPCTARTSRRCKQRADIAMYSAKQAGRGYAIFEPGSTATRRAASRSPAACARRSTKGEITLYYQPKADLRTGRIIGVEALARWDHPEFGIVGPSEFVPIAEQTGLITPLTSLRARRRAAPGARVEGRRAGADGRRQPLRPLVPGHAARGRDPAPAREAGASRPSCSSSRSPRAC